MNDYLSILLTEYSQIRESERATRNLLYRINGFAIAVVSGLLVGMTSYQIKELSLVAPLLFYLIGFFWNCESTRLLRINQYVRILEHEVRSLVDEEDAKILNGFEHMMHSGHGLSFIFRYHNVAIVATLFYGIFYLLFLYLLAVSSYSIQIKISLILLYILFGGSFWFFDLWRNRHHWLRPKDEF